jgi:hypothetical protein
VFSRKSSRSCDFRLFSIPCLACIALVSATV